jgi:ABC-type glycerol-3-phosphate transport system substrate-binding protein
MIWFKRIVLGILLLGTAIVLSAPSRRGEQIPPGRTVIRYWSYWTGREADQMQQIIDVFNTTVGKERNIWVSYISISQADQKTLLATSAGVPPDVAGVWGDQLAQFAAMGTVEPLETMAAEHGITEAYYKPAYWKACSFEGHLYALIATPYSVALYYNKKIFAERADKLRAAGLDPTRPPKTIDELDRYSAALDVWSAPKEQGGQLLAAGFFEQQPGWWREHLYHWFGGSIYDEQTKKLTLNDPKVVAAYDWLQSYTKRIGRDQVLRFVSGLPTTDTFDTPLNPFMTGAVAMIKQGPWFSSYMETLKPEMNRVKWSKEEERKLPRAQRRDNYVWGVAPFPSAVPGLENVSYAGSDLLVIPSTSHHKKEAFEFIAFVNRQDQMEHLCSMHGKNSPLAKMSQEYLDNHPNPYIEVFEELGASPNNFPVPPIPLWPELRSELQTISGTLVLDENLSAKELLDKAQAKYQAKVDDYVRRRDKRRELGLLK